MQWLKDALELLAPGWVGSIIGLGGIAAAIITYVLTRQRARFAYRYAGERLLGLSAEGLPTDITVQYRGQEIPRLTRTLVVFWNAGEKTLPSEDIVSSDPLRLRLRDDGRILAATVLKQARDVCQVQAQYDPSNPSEVAISFAFLDSGDGAVVEILHTGEKRHADFLGTIRGIPNGLHDLGRIAAQRYMRDSFPMLVSPRKLGWVASAVGLAIAGAALLVPWQYLEQISAVAFPGGLVIAGAGTLYALLGLALIFLTRRRYPKALHIDELG